MGALEVGGKPGEVVFQELEELKRKSEGSQWLGLTNECHQCPWMGESSVGWGTKSRISMAGGGPEVIKRRDHCRDNSSQKTALHLSRKLSLGGGWYLLRLSVG